MNDEQKIKLADVVLSYEKYLRQAEADSSYPFQLWVDIQEWLEENGFPIETH